jgi:hemoglobin
MEVENAEGILFDRLGGRAGLLKLLKHFYADVRQHQLIGPVFMEHIEDWPAHLEVIADFWSGLTGGPAQYRGGMPIKHFPLGLTEAHFEAWLTLWKHNCRTQLTPQEAEEMTVLANRIGVRLREILRMTDGR